MEPCSFSIVIGGDLIKETKESVALVPPEPRVPELSADRHSADRHPAAVYVARLAPGSRRAMGQALEVIAGILGHGRATVESFPWASLRYQHVQAVRAALGVRYAPAAANKILSALRGVAREAWRLGLMAGEDHSRIADVEGFKGQASQPPRGRALKVGELVSLFGACDASTAQGARDAALLALLLGAGLRRSEAVGLDLGDYDADTGELRIRHGKGGRTRTVYATNGAKEALAAWLDVRGDQAGPLLLAVGRNDEPHHGRRLTGQAIYTILERLRFHARVKPFSPHDCRRSFITSLLGAGASIAVVQKLAGHASVNTTARYDRSEEDAKRKAAEMLHLPFAR
jgi:site-specific recombinase XerD